MWYCARGRAAFAVTTVLLTIATCSQKNTAGEPRGYSHGSATPVDESIPLGEQQASRQQASRQQASRSHGDASSCAESCLVDGRGCRACVKLMAEQHFVTPRVLALRYAKAHSGIPDPRVAIEHHHFRDRPPHTLDAAGKHYSSRCTLILDGDTKQSHLIMSTNVLLVEPKGKTHADCPAMRGRSGVGAVTIRMPYTARFFRDGAIEVECDWIESSVATSPGPYVHRIDIPVSDSPWFRLPQSHLHIFTIGDTRAHVWIINSGVYIDDSALQNSPGAKPQDKGGSVGYKWLVQPLPHRLDRNSSHQNDDRLGWRIEQAVLSSFVRVSQSANIPLQLDFTTVSPSAKYIQIDKGIPMLQYVPTTLPSISLEEQAIDPDLVDYLVSLSLIHNGGDYRKLGTGDHGASSIMRSHALSDEDDQTRSHGRQRMRHREL